MIKKTLLLGVVLFILLTPSTAQISSDMKEVEQMLAASTKQVNQFFRRFNGEENEKGDRLYPKDRAYHAANLRKKFLPNLFDQQNRGFDKDQVKDFFNEVLDKKSPFFLDLHGDEWFAEVNTTFLLNNKEVQGLLYLKLEAQGQGYAWTISDVSFDHIKQPLTKDEKKEETYFLHPMSHELSFMTFRKAFKNRPEAVQYTSKGFVPDQLSVFIYQINSGQLTYKSVQEVTFHFFQKENWYFALNNFNRNDTNSGWLISSLVPIQSEKQETQLKNYIYDR